MIFVTVGTHEQQFDRLVSYMDKWAGQNEEEVVIQTGYSVYEPVNCRWSRLYPYKKMRELSEEAGIVISHGGPSSFIVPIQSGRIPIVVPRRKKYGEHINDHQLEFCRELKERWGNILVVEDIDELEGMIKNYNEIIKNIRNDYKSNNESFCSAFKKMIGEM
ncbi:MAG: multidrug MFS transporter [Lachnospiraceae bacterium]|nr:multidrug MFS transporter [Lachnospiraceae bacterium]